jgi:hypothetical protein
MLIALHTIWWDQDRFWGSARDVLGGAGWRFGGKAGSGSRFLRFRTVDPVVSATLHLEKQHEPAIRITTEPRQIHQATFHPCGHDISGTQWELHRARSPCHLSDSPDDDSSHLPTDKARGKSPCHRCRQLGAATGERPAEGLSQRSNTPQCWVEDCIQLVVASPTKVIFASPLSISSLLLVRLAGLPFPCLTARKSLLQTNSS